MLDVDEEEVEASSSFISKLLSLFVSGLEDGITKIFLGDDILKDDILV